MAQSVDIVRKELSVLPHAVKLLLKYLDEAGVNVHFEYDSYQLAMVDVLEVRPQSAKVSTFYGATILAFLPSFKDRHTVSLQSLCTRQDQRRLSLIKPHKNICCMLL